MIPVIRLGYLLRGLALSILSLAIVGCGGSGPPIDEYAEHQEITIFLAQALPEIFDPFDYTVMTAYFTPELGNYSISLGMEGIFESIGTIAGPLRDYEIESWEIGRDVELDYDLDADAYAIYVIKSKFRNTDGTIKLQMAKQNGRWYIVLWSVETFRS